MKKWVPELTIEYKPDGKQEIADSWATVFNDSLARTEWGWEPSVSLVTLVEIIINNLSKFYRN